MSLYCLLAVVYYIEIKLNKWPKRLNFYLKDYVIINKMSIDGYQDNYL